MLLLMPEVGGALLVIATNNPGGKLQQSGKTQTGWLLRVKQVGWGTGGQCKVIVKWVSSWADACRSQPQLDMVQAHSERTESKIPSRRPRRWQMFGFQSICFKFQPCCLPANCPQLFMNEQFGKVHRFLYLRHVENYLPFWIEGEDGECRGGAWRSL